MRLQGAGPPERQAIAVGAPVVPALLVHHLDVPRQGDLLPEGTWAVRACVVPALLVHRLDVPRQVALSPESARAVGARMVPALLVHRLDVRLQALLRLVGDAALAGSSACEKDHRQAVNETQKGL